MIRVHCFTNLDDFKRLEWPVELPAVPAIGHSIAAKSGKQLKIVAITWQFDGSLEIELHR